MRIAIASAIVAWCACARADVKLTKLDGEATGRARWTADGASFWLPASDGEHLVEYDRAGKRKRAISIEKATERAQLDLDAPDGPRALAPGGARLLTAGVEADGGRRLYAIELATGDAAALTDGREYVLASSWLDDARALVVSFAGAPRASIVDAAGATPFCAELPFVVAARRIDAQTIAVASDRLYLTNERCESPAVAFGHVRSLQDHPVAFAASPSGRALAAVFFLPGAPPAHELYVAAARFARPVRVGEIAENTTPAWLDEDRLLYELDRGAPAHEHTLMLYSLKDAKSHPALPPKPGCHDTHVSASPTGGAAVFQRACLAYESFTALIH